MTFANGIVQDQVQVLEFHDAMEALGEFVKQFTKVAMLSDRLGHLEQRLVPSFRGSSGRRVNRSVVHRFENSIVICRGSTCQWRGLQPAGFVACKDEPSQAEARATWGRT